MIGEVWFGRRLLMRSFLHSLQKRLAFAVDDDITISSMIGEVWFGQRLLVRSFLHSLQKRLAVAVSWRRYHDNVHDWRGLTRWRLLMRSFLHSLQKIDTTWKHGIMKDLFDVGLRGCLLIFVQAFFRIDGFKLDWALTCPTSSNRKWQSHRAASYQLLSLHFKLTLLWKVSPGVECSLYVDDFLICYRSKFVDIIERHLQRSLNKLQHWVDSHGFKFSPTKTVCVHFCSLCKAHPDPQLLLNGTPIRRGS